MQGLPTDQRLDFGCALCDGGFDTLYDEQGDITVTKSAADSSLIFFFLRLLHRLQQVATVPAIDYAEYSSLLVCNESNLLR
jgi:hypothetical protein